MNKKFNEWWDEGLDTKDNPFRKSSPAYWAWEGWVAGSAAQREWVGLTTDEVFELSSTKLPHGLFAGLIEAKLKEKNEN